MSRDESNLIDLSDINLSNNLQTTAKKNNINSLTKDN
jgi:hypothetical protein